VLTDDYFAVADNAIKDIRSVLTVVAGRIVYADAEYTDLEQN
jgi:predicted amidohydrolase YtcJ